MSERGEVEINAIIRVARLIKKVNPAQKFRSPAPLHAIPALIAALCVLGLPRARPAEDRNKALTLAGAGP